MRRIVRTGKEISKPRDTRPICVRCYQPFWNEGTRANLRGRCRKSCNGMLRDFGGYPKNPTPKQEGQSALVSKRRSKVFAYKPRLFSQEFYGSKAWLAVRYVILKQHRLTTDGGCLVCGSWKPPLHVDHIKPRSKYPELELDINNLQVLCHDCNMGKSNKDEIDWRNYDQRIHDV